MQHPHPDKRHRHPAPCRGARHLLIIAMGASALVALATAADLFSRGGYQDDAAHVWMQAMTLSTPALWPAGSPMRHPETVHPGIDLRFCAGVVTAP